MRTYTVITGNVGLAEHLLQNPYVVRNRSYRVTGDFDEDGAYDVDDASAILVNPDGEIILRLGTIQREFMDDVRHAVELDMLGQKMGVPAATGERPHYHGTTGDQAAAAVLKHYQAEAWDLSVVYHEGMPDDHIQILDGGRVVANVPTNPRDLLVPSTVAEVRQYHETATAANKAVTEVAATVDPAPARSAPPKAAAAAKSQRKAGQAIQPAPVVRQGDIILLRIDQLGHFPGGNVREQFAGLEELAADIKRRGIMSPLSVNERDGTYTLIAGERRLRAAGLAGLTEVPCQVHRLDDTAALEWMLVENIQRSDLNPIEEARAYQRLLKIHGDQGAVAAAVGKSRIHVNEVLTLLEVPDALAQRIASGDVAAKVGMVVVRMTRHLPDNIRERVATQVAAQAPSSREAAAAIDRALESAGVARATPPKPEPAPRPEPPKQAPAPASPTRPAARSPEPTPVFTPIPTPEAPALAREAPAPVAATVAHLESVDLTRVHQLAEIGRAVWNSSQRGAGEVLLAREAYLSLELVLAHWEKRRKMDPSAAGLPKQLGTMAIDIPEQRVWIRQHFSGPAPQVTIDGTRLILNAGSGGAEAIYSGNPIYYREELHRVSGVLRLEHQLVIQDGNRHLVVGGMAQVVISQGPMAVWRDVLAALPGVPD